MGIKYDIYVLPNVAGCVIIVCPSFSKFVLRLFSYLHYNLMFWSELFLLSDISLESGILCLCIYSMNPIKMSKLVTEETNMNCSDWVNLNGSHIHKSTYNTYLQISNVYARIHIYFCQTFTMAAVIPRMLCIPLSIIDDLYIFSLDTMISIIAWL